MNFSFFQYNISISFFTYNKYTKCKHLEPFIVNDYIDILQHANMFILTCHDRNIIKTLPM